MNKWLLFEIIAILVVIGGILIVDMKLHISLFASIPVLVNKVTGIPNRPTVEIRNQSANKVVISRH